MIDIDDVAKAGPVRVTPRPLQQKLQLTVPLNPINQRITTPINTSSMARHPLTRREVRVQSKWTFMCHLQRGIECCDSGYPETKTLQY